MKSVFTVSEVNAYISKLLKGDFLLAHLSVKGEVSNFKLHVNGKCYFSIKDSSSSIRVIMPVEEYEKSGVQVKDGTEVLISGRLYLNERSGDYCIYVSFLEETGVGRAYRDFEKLKRKLEEEGLFDVKNKMELKIPSLTVGVVTSPTGAAIHDIISVIRRRFLSANIFVYPALVQGDAAPKQLISGVEFFNSFFLPDVIIVGRGGGSYEDLSAFNDEALAHSIYCSKIPVISAVGHQVDFTIADFVSDIRAATPSHAAELIVQTKEKLGRSISDRMAQIRLCYQNQIRKKRIYLEERMKALSKHDPAQRFEERKKVLRDRLSRLHSLWIRQITKKRIELNRRYQKLIGFEPLSVASIVDGMGEPITSIKDVFQGELIRILMPDGIISVQVISTENQEWATDMERGM